MTRILTLSVLVVLVVALSWNPEPSSPVAPGSVHVSWSGWPFLFKQNHRRVLPNGTTEIASVLYAKPELSINVGVAIAIIAVSYFGLTKHAYERFPRFTILDTLSMMVGCSIATAYFAANPDMHLWNLRYLYEGSGRHSLYVLQRPIWQNTFACIIIVIAGYSASLLLVGGQRWITKR